MKQNYRVKISKIPRRLGEVQIILAGPPDDACGLYAGTLLDQLGPPGGLAAFPRLVGVGGLVCSWYTVSYKFGL